MMDFSEGARAVSGRISQERKKVKEGVSTTSEILSQKEKDYQETFKKNEGSAFRQALANQQLFSGDDALKEGRKEFKSENFKKTN